MRLTILGFRKFKAMQNRVKKMTQDRVHILIVGNRRKVVDGIQYQFKTKKSLAGS